MTFTKEEIKPYYVGIVDIGTYKVRVGICKIINRDVELIGYGEKRQDTNDINLQEIKNLEGVCETIKQALNKAESDAKLKVDDIITNIPTPNLFFEASKINYKRDDLSNEIDDDELLKILTKIELEAFKRHYKRIKETTGYNKNDLKLIISNIFNILLDNKTSKKIIGTNPEEINFSVMNVFLTEAKYEIIEYIGKYISKNILKVIPSEFAMTGLFQAKKDIVIIDLGNSHTSIIVKKGGAILGAKKLSFGIEDFIKEIRKKHKLTRSDIISKIDENIFELEKIEFLEIFKDILAITLSDILKKEVCPNKFFMSGGGANKFIKNYLENTNFDAYDLKIAKKIEFVSPSIDFIDDKITENPTWVDGAKSNINIYAMIKTTLDFIKKDKNKIEKTLKEVLNLLEK